MKIKVIDDSISNFTRDRIYEILFTSYDGDYTLYNDIGEIKVLYYTQVEEVD